MVKGSTKRVVIIRNIESNLIEEAILILKSEPGNNENMPAGPDPRAGKGVEDDVEAGVEKCIGKDAEKDVEKSRERGLEKAVGKGAVDECLLKEAEAIINSYIRENRLYILHDSRQHHTGQKSRLQELCMSRLAINLALIGGIALLILLFIMLL